jgi:hypothetical protein
VPLPPDRMPLMRGGRPLKTWTYVGAFGPELMLCVASARVGVVPTAWWAIWDRASGRLVQRTARGRGGVTVSSSRVAVAGRTVALELALGDGAPVEVVSPHGSQYAWTRKRGGVAARGWIERDGLRRELALRAIVDESAGYHARRTAWRWSAGVGTAASGAAVAWNVTDGLHDAPQASERTVWVDGHPHEIAPLAFAPGLAGVGELRFTREAVRARHEDLWLVASDYEQPFGSFAGSLPVAGALASGWGVMERHEARW